jgi:4'-phosphopantetheinyl transferase
MRTLSADDFLTATPPVELGDDEIHLWIFPKLRNVSGTMSNAASLLRATLAAYLGQEADTVRIERNSAGKPFLADAALQFNLSHSGESLLIGLSRAQPLGVDIESGARTRPWLDLAQRFFTVDETAALAALPAERLARAFLELWSCKEAVLKAIGRGIAFGLDRVGFQFDAHGAVARLVHLGEEAGSPAEWRVVRLAPEDGIGGALAWHGPERRIRAFRCDAPPDNLPAAATIPPARSSE